MNIRRYLNAFDETHSAANMHQNTRSLVGYKHNKSTVPMQDDIYARMIYMKDR